MSRQSFLLDRKVPLNTIPQMARLYNISLILFIYFRKKNRFTIDTLYYFIVSIQPVACYQQDRTRSEIKKYDARKLAQRSRRLVCMSICFCTLR